MNTQTNHYCLKEMGFKIRVQAIRRKVFHRASCVLWDSRGFISSSSTVSLMRDFLDRSVCAVWRRVYDRAGWGGAHGETLWSICQQKHGQYVLVRKLTSRSTDPVALFGVNVHSRGVDVLDTGVLLCFCCDVKQEKLRKNAHCGHNFRLYQRITYPAQHLSMVMKVSHNY